jgi:hypothetical protein
MVIVTGMHRSGTTFLGNILEQSKHFNYIHEPLNYNHGLVGVPGWYPYINPVTKADDHGLIALLNDLHSLNFKFKLHYEPGDNFLKKTVRKFIKGQGHLDYLKYKLSFNKKEILLKDPFLSLCGAYFANEFKDVKAVYIVRHPVAFYKSIERMEWNFDFNNLYDQTNLFNDYLSKFDFHQPESNTLIETAPALWNIINTIILDHVAFLGPNKAYLLKHEDLSINPDEEISKLFSFLGIPVTDGVSAYIKKNMTQGIIQPNSKVLFEFSRDSKQLAYSWKKNYKIEYDEIIKKNQSLLKRLNYE